MSYFEPFFILLLLKTNIIIDTVLLRSPQYKQYRLLSDNPDKQMLTYSFFHTRVQMILVWLQVYQVVLLTEIQEQDTSTRHWCPVQLLLLINLLW